MCQALTLVLMNADKVAFIDLKSHFDYLLRLEMEITCYNPFIQIRTFFCIKILILTTSSYFLHFKKENNNVQVFCLCAFLFTTFMPGALRCQKTASTGRSFRNGVTNDYWLSCVL